ncbi:hypothetical protein STRTUCAR8_03363, partial [Streptomyces turgidiscabies Car8]
LSDGLRSVAAGVGVGSVAKAAVAGTSSAPAATPVRTAIRSGRRMRRRDM